MFKRFLSVSGVSQFFSDLKRTVGFCEHHPGYGSMDLVNDLNCQRSLPPFRRSALDLIVHHLL